MAKHRTYFSIWRPPRSILITEFTVPLPTSSTGCTKPQLDTVGCSRATGATRRAGRACAPSDAACVRSWHPRPRGSHPRAPNLPPARSPRCVRSRRRTSPAATGDSRRGARSRRQPPERPDPTRGRPGCGTRCRDVSAAGTVPAPGAGERAGACRPSRSRRRGPAGAAHTPPNHTPPSQPCRGGGVWRPRVRPHPRRRAIGLAAPKRLFVSARRAYARRRSTEHDQLRRSATPPAPGSSDSSL